MMDYAPPVTSPTKRLARTVFVMFLLTFIAIACFHPTPLWANTVSDLVNKYYLQMGDPDGTSALMTRVELQKELPTADRDEFIAEIIDRAAQDPRGADKISTALSMLNAKGQARAWSPHLEQAVIAQAKNPDVDVRALLVGVVSSHNSEKYRDLCLSYLEDSNEIIRYRAVSAIENWPDGKDILRKYAHDHHATRPGDPGDAVVEANWFVGHH